MQNSISCLRPLSYNKSMKRTLFLVALLALSACGKPGDNTPPPDEGTQVIDGFTLSFAPTKTDFYLGQGETGTVKITADITKPAEVSQLKVSVSSGVTFLSVDPVETYLSDGSSKDISIVVSATAQTGQVPYLTVTVEGLDARGDVVTGQIREDYRWTLK
jgi:hypothetical protein